MEYVHTQATDVGWSWRSQAHFLNRRYLRRATVSSSEDGQVYVRSCAVCRVDITLRFAGSRRTTTRR